MDALVARKTWRTLEPYHGLVYFAAEPAEQYAALGIDGQDGYFASRSAPMGRVSPEVVVATFFNFNPALVRRALPAAWEVTSPAALIEARLAGMDAVLGRVLGPDVLRSAEVTKAAAMARTAAEACAPAGRPLAAAHAALPWPGEPHLALWHAITVLREHRGDGHVACLLAAGLDGTEALVVHAATGEAPAAALQTTRGWPDDVWQAAVQRLAERDWLGEDGGLTEGGAARREQIEARTDELALGPWEVLGEDGCAELRTLVRPLSRAIVESGSFGFGPATRAAQEQAPTN